MSSKDSEFFVSNEHLKQWIQKEHRRQGKAGVTPLGLPVEKRHDLHPPPLDSVRSLKSVGWSQADGPASSRQGKSIYDMSWPKDEVSQRLRPPPIKPQPPHFAHHHHFGWGPAQMNDRVADDITDFSHSQHKKYGDALNYCEVINSKSHVLLTKRA